MFDVRADGKAVVKNQNVHPIVPKYPTDIGGGCWWIVVVLVFLVAFALGFLCGWGSMQ